MFRDSCGCTGGRLSSFIIRLLLGRYLEHFIDVLKLPLFKTLLCHLLLSFNVVPFDSMNTILHKNSPALDYYTRTITIFMSAKIPNSSKAHRVYSWVFNNGSGIKQNA